MLTIYLGNIDDLYQDFIYPNFSTGGIMLSMRVTPIKNNLITLFLCMSDLFYTMIYKALLNLVLKSLNNEKSKVLKRKGPTSWSKRRKAVGKGMNQPTRSYFCIIRVTRNYQSTMNIFSLWMGWQSGENDRRSKHCGIWSLSGTRQYWNEISIGLCRQRDAGEWWTFCFLFFEWKGWAMRNQKELNQARIKIYIPVD